MNIKEFFKRLLAGAGIGAGAAIPGVSGAAIAVILHVYEDIIHAVNSFRKKFGWSIKVLLPILVGVLLAVAICVYSFSYAMQYMMFALICIFAGFIVGSLPGITDEIKGVKLNKKHKAIFAISVIFVALLGVLSVILGNSGFSFSAYFSDLNSNWWMYLVLIPVGILASVALTVPGLSGSLILVIIGFYKPLITNTKGWASEIFKGNFSNTLQLFLMLACFAIGCLIGVILVSKIMTRLLAKHYDETFIAIIGFTIGSIFVLFFNFDIFEYYLVWGGNLIEGITPLLNMWIEIPIGVVIACICGFLSYQLVRHQRKSK